MTDEARLRTFIAKFSLANQRLIRAARRVLRAKMPNANELVYDSYNFLVIAYCPSEKVSESYLSLGADKHGANLFFGYNGTKLADPRKLLQGSGTSNRFVRFESASALEQPALGALITSAIETSRPMGDETGKLIVRAVSETQRSRR
jgi:hypothetical protein